jgi:hypothetical protein
VIAATELDELEKKLVQLVSEVDMFVIDKKVFFESLNRPLRVILVLEREKSLNILVNTVNDRREFL